MNIRCICIFSLLIISNSCAREEFPWAVIGAGHAGITSVVQLLEHGISAKDILWIDPEFNVGRLGKYYANVPSNQQVHRFTKYLSSCSLFKELHSETLEAIKKCDQNQEPFLQLIIEPLKEITHYLSQRVVCCQDTVHELIYENNYWALKLTADLKCARKVILAIGSRPKRMSYSDILEIPLDLALDEQILKSLVGLNDVVMVIGSAHSALLVVKYLSEVPVKKIINVYTKRPTYGKYGGLEGVTARWTKNVLEQNPPRNLMRILFSPEVVEQYKKECNKIIYAFGYERNPIKINGSYEISCDEKTGIIQPHLYGIGIAFPPKYQTPEGIIVNLIGVNSFMEYAKERMPRWINE